MANHKSAKKRAKQTIVKTLRNKSKKTQVRTAIKNLRLAISENNKETAGKLLVQVQSLLARLASSGVMKRQTSARLTSRLSAQVGKL